ncbi:MAG: hypothetical protein HN922_07720 [Anaerolineae bacterium]|nr:hypothetical protein [Anaerolineae bacterium]
MTIFIWSLGLVMLTPMKHLLLAGVMCLLVIVIVYPHSFRSLLRFRWLMMIIVLVTPPIFLLGDLDRSFWNILYSSEGVGISLQIFLRVIVVLASVDGFTNSVDISSVAGLLERFGLKGLGFSMGVALNLLPSLKIAAINTWRSLWMRGGLRKQRLRGIRLLFLTVITNALRRSEEIALAAETRAFCPERCQPMPLQVGSWDRSVLVISVSIILVITLI